MPGFVPGAIPDARTEAEKQNDIGFVEIVASAAPVAWREKGPADWRKYPIFNQNGSGSCVAQTMRKLLGIIHQQRHGTFINFSASDIYQRRANKPAQGMGGVDVFDIAAEGVTLNDFVPSDGLSDAQMDKAPVLPYQRSIGQIFKLGAPIYLPVGDIETVASVIQQTGKGVMVWTYWENAEWQPVPVILNPALKLENAPGRHSTAGTDFGLYQGEKALIIDDSWDIGAGFNGQRVLTERFFKARNFFAAYAMNFKFDEPEAGPQKPVHNFAKTLVFIPLDSRGRIADPVKNSEQQAEVAALQDVLKFEGLFPANVDSTGYYGAVTAKAVYQFQVKYQVAPAAELDELQGKAVGPKTIKVLNQKYG